MIITNRDPGLPELRFLASSGGLFLDFTIHDFDMARWLLGEDPVEVFAWGAVLVDPRVRTEGKDIDTAMLLLRTEVREDVPHQQHAPRGVRLRPAHRGVRLEGHAARREPRRRPASSASARRRPARDNPWPNFQTRYNAAYAAEMASFIHSVEKKKPAEIPPEDSRKVLLLCEAALKSSQTGKPVRIKN